MKLPQIYGEEIIKEIKMKNKISFIFAVTAISFLFGKFLVHEDQNTHWDVAYAQAEKLDEETEEKRSDVKKPILEEKGITEGTSSDKKVALPTEMPATKSETFRMFQTIKKKNQELKRREEELKIKELKLKEIEAKVSKNLEKIEKRISKSKQQLGIQEEKTKEYLENKYRSALWLIKSIDQRRQTIYKVGKSIVKLQKTFMDQGLSYLQPMVLKDVAEDIEMHESTVSRITTNKYIDTPQGIFELKFL